MDSSLRDHYIVCGMGHVGFRIALLLRRLGFPVAAVHDTTPDDWLLEAERAGVVCVHGDARNDQVLLKAGVERARAIIAVTDQDMANVSVALDSQRLHPGMVTVVRLFDLQLARHVEEGLQTRQALSASALAAPVFAAAAFGVDVIGHFTLDGRNYALVERDGDTCAPDSELQPLFAGVDGRVQHASAGTGGHGGAKILAIYPETHGDQCVGGRHGRRGWLARTAATVLTAIHQVPLGARILLATLIGIILLGVFVVHRSLELSFVDSVYFIVTTVTTTGYGDVSFLHAPSPVKLFGCFLMVSGAALLALLFGMITDALITHRLRGLLAMGPVGRQGHIIVAGANHVAFRIVETLAGHGHDVVSVGPDVNDSAALGALRVPVVRGDARMESVLRTADVERAAAVIAVDEDDVVNLGVGLLAKKMNGGVRTVVRVFDGALADKLQNQLAVDRVMSVSAVAAPSFVAACLFPHIDQAIVWHDHLLVLRSGLGNGDGPADPYINVALQHDPDTGRLVTTSPQHTNAGAALHVSLHRLSELP